MPAEDLNRCERRRLSVDEVEDLMDPVTREAATVVHEFRLLANAYERLEPSSSAALETQRLIASTLKQLRRQRAKIEMALEHSNQFADTATLRRHSYLLLLIEAGLRDLHAAIN